MKKYVFQGIFYIKAKVYSIFYIKVYILYIKVYILQIKVYILYIKVKVYVAYNYCIVSPCHVQLSYSYPHIFNTWQHWPYNQFYTFFFPRLFKIFVIKIIFYILNWGKVTLRFSIFVFNFVNFCLPQFVDLPPLQRDFDSFSSLPPSPPCGPRGTTSSSSSPINFFSKCYLKSFLGHHWNKLF